MGRHLKNVIVASVGFSFAFTATGSLQSLQVKWIVFLSCCSSKTVEFVDLVKYY